MSNNTLNEMSEDELLNQLKMASMELYTNVDNIDEKQDIVENVNEKNKEQVLSDFSKFTRLVRKYKKVQAELKELEVLNPDNVELQRYIKLLEKVTDIEKELDSAKKGYLYESAINAPNVELENNDVKVTVTLPYDKKDFDSATFEKDYGPETEMYQKYVVIKRVKGNIKYKIK